MATTPDRGVLLELANRVADLPRSGERTEEGALNPAQVEQIIIDARSLLSQPTRRPDYDAEDGQ